MTIIIRDPYEIDDLRKSIPGKIYFKIPELARNSRTAANPNIS